MTQQGKPLPSDRTVCWAHSLLLFPGPPLKSRRHRSTLLGSGVEGPLANCLKKEKQRCQDEGVEPKGRCHHEPSVKEAQICEKVKPRRMKPGRSTVPFRELTTVEPGSKLVSRPDWEPEPPQIPITQPASEPEKTPIAQPASKAQQAPYLPQNLTAQQRPLAQQETEAQQEPPAQQKSTLHQEFRAPQESALQLSPPTQRVTFSKQEAASQHRPEPGKESRTQQNPELREGARAQRQPEPQNEPPAQTEPMSQERQQQSELAAQGVKSGEESLAEWRFLSKRNEPPEQPSTSESKTFIEWVTDSGTKPDVGFTLDIDSPATLGRMADPGKKPAFKEQPGYEMMSGFGGMPTPRKKISSQNPRQYRYTGELSLEEGRGGGAPKDGHSFSQELRPARTSGELRSLSSSPDTESEPPLMEEGAEAWRREGACRGLSSRGGRRCQDPQPASDSLPCSRPPPRGDRG